MRFGRIRLASLAGALVVFAPGPARAQSSPSTVSAATEADRVSARKLFEDGKTKRDRGDKEGALDAFTQADAIMVVPTTRLAVARALFALDRFAEARDTAASVAALPSSSKEPAPFVDARASAAELVRELDERLPTIAFEVEGRTPAQVAVTIDDKPLAPRAIAGPVRVNSGHHVIVATASDGAKPWRAELELVDRERRSLTLGFEPVAGEPPVAPAAAPPRRHGVSPLVWSGLGVFAAGLTVGGVAGAVSLGKKSDLRDRCPGGSCPPPAHGTLDAAHTWATVSTIGFVVAAVGAVGAGLAYLFVPSPTAPVSGVTAGWPVTLRASAAGWTF